MLTFSDINMEEAQQKKPISSLICCPLLSQVSHMTQVHLLLYPKASVYYYFYYNYYHLIITKALLMISVLTSGLNLKRHLSQLLLTPELSFPKTLFSGMK